MSTDPDKDTACPNESDAGGNERQCGDNLRENVCEKKFKKQRNVSFPDEDEIVTQYFEPPNPWHEVPPTTRAQLAAEYLESCRRHNTLPIDSVLLQIRDIPESSIGGCVRAPRLTLTDCSLQGCAPSDALEAVFSRVQFRKVHLDHVALDDEGAESIFDMIEYYESALVVCISGPRQFGIRGWQAASRMIKKSAELSELEVRCGTLEAAHTPVLARALRPLSCRLRALCLQRAALAGEPLLCLVIALKSNRSVREVRLGDNNLTTTDAHQLAALLRLNTYIQLLDLSNNQIQDAGVGHIADALAEQAAQTPPSAATSPISPQHYPVAVEPRGLAFLVLWNNQLTRNCAMHLSKALRCSQSLCVLNVGRNAVGCEAVRALQAEAGGALVSLGLQAARLGPDAAAPLADLIRADTHLQRLDLRDNRLGSAGLQVLLAALQENSTITQLDLDDPVESRHLVAEEHEAAAANRATRDIRALCRRNEPSATPTSAHRKISLTCHTPAFTHTLQSPSCEEDRRSRLRSPAPSPAPSPSPSPAGSPVPPQHSRFSVTPVTPEPEAPPPPRPAFCSTPSRFKVIQVSEPEIHIHSGSATVQPRRTTSRFSVSRNYDTMYNPPIIPAVVATSSAPVVSAGKSGENRPKSGECGTKCGESGTKVGESGTKVGETGVKCILKEHTDSRVIEKGCSDASVPKGCIRDEIPKVLVSTSDSKNDELRPVSKHCGLGSTECEVKAAEKDEDRLKSDNGGSMCDKMKSCLKHECKDNVSQTVSSPIQCGAQIRPDVTATIEEDIKPKPRPSIVPGSENCIFNPTYPIPPRTIKSSADIGTAVTQEGLSKADETKPGIIVTKPESVTISDNKSDAKSEMIGSDSYSDIVKRNYKDKSENSERVKSENSKGVKSDNKEIKCETKLVSNSVDESDSEILDITVTLKTECLQAKVDADQNSFRKINEVTVNKDEIAMKPMDTLREKLGNLMTEMKDFGKKTVRLDVVDKVPNKDVLKKNKSESSLDSPDLEVSRFMDKKLGSPFRDSSSSLEISGSSIESLNMEHQNLKEYDREQTVDRIKVMEFVLSKLSGIESASDVTPVNSGNLLNLSVSSNESVSPVMCGMMTKMHDSLSSLEASVSSLDSGRQDKVMVLSADSGIEYSLQNPSDNKDDTSSNEGTLTNNSSLKETAKKSEVCLQDTLTSSPKRTSSSLDVPALKNRTEKMRKIAQFAQSPSFHIPYSRPDISSFASLDKETKLSHLEKLLSIFQHPSSIFSRSQSDEERKSNTPPRKDSAMTSSFWSWGSATEKTDKEERDEYSSSEATDSTLSERVQVSFVDESFSKKFDSKTPSTDTDNTLSEFQSFPIQGNSENSDFDDRNVTETTDRFVVQIDVSLKPTDDLMKPYDSSKVVDKPESLDENKIDDKEPVRPRSFAAVLRSSGSENSLEKQTTPENGQPVNKLPSKVIRGIKENISPENTLTSSMTNTKALAVELAERQMKSVNTVCVVTLLDKCELKSDEIKAPIATIEETCDEAADNNIQLDFIDDVRIDEKNLSTDSGVTSLDAVIEDKKIDKVIDLGKDALSYLIYENQEFDEKAQTSLAQELKDAEIKEMLDLSPELVIDEAIELPEVFTVKETIGIRTSPIIPERAKLKKSNSLEDITQLQSTEEEKISPKTKTIAFKVPESTRPRDIPERRAKLRSRSGSSPKSLPESLNKPCPLAKMDAILKKKKKVSSLGKIARDSLLALNMSDEEIAEFRKSYITSVESLRSLESVSEDANSQSGNSVDSRCRACLRTSQESLMSLDSITEDCRCTDDCEKPGRSAR